MNLRNSLDIELILLRVKSAMILDLTLFIARLTMRLLPFMNTSDIEAFARHNRHIS